MTVRPGEDVDRLHELLADRAVEGLDPADHSELARLLIANPDVNARQFDWASAALDLALGPRTDEPLPDPLREQLGAAAIEWMAETRPARPTRPAAPGASASPTAASSEPIRGARFGWGPWLVAAACLLLAVSVWLARPPAGPATPDELLAADPDALVSGWAGNDLGVRGDIVWSGRLQAGFLRLRGLPVNDPKALQYQLWIFDARRGTKYNAVDGGVFDVDRATGEVVIPVDAKLDVFEPVLFAVTTEPSGGVVKHDPDLDGERFRIILTAPAE